MPESVDQKVVVIGLGYIGLPTAAILAHNGVHVTGVDVDASRVEAVNSGRVPFVEPDLEAYLSRGVASGHLQASTDTPAADIYIVAVPTPFAEQHQADLSFIEAAARGIAPQLVGGELVILESTSPPGTTEHLAAFLMEQRADLSIDGSGGRPVVEFAHCPERVLPGRVMVELVENDRIIGGVTASAAERARSLYATFCEGELHMTDARTAELAKLTENAFRDVNIAFANELANVSQAVGVDVFELIDLANKHPRVNILQPGPGVGGHCIAVDPWFIVAAAPDEARLIRTAREVNDARPGRVVDVVLEAVDGIESPSIALLGLAFKPDIDDLRQSPALEIAVRVAGLLPDASIMAVEPNITELPAELLGLANASLTPYEEAIRRADVVVLLVDHKEFKKLPVEERPTTLVIDTRGAWR